jgi:succinyl-diaminopimelate desuccinylase
MTIDPIELTQALIRCPSVTPADEGALDVLRRAIEPLGFACHRLRFAADGTPDIDNLYARLGTRDRNFCFAGHTDVVPPGNPAGWTVNPFKAEIIDGQVYGRGAADMKGAIAAFAAAAARFVKKRGRDFGGSISLLITGDEEGPAINGTAKVLDWMKQKGETIDLCVVGEPTNEKQLGDMAKIGRRGSMNLVLTAIGQQGHVAYPHLAENPNHILVRMLADLTAKPLDEGTDFFQPSSLQVTTIDIGNPTTNIAPGLARATFNIRFNDLWSSATLKAWVEEKFAAVGGKYRLAWEVSGESFLVPPGPVSECLAAAIGSVTGRTPELSTTGGTSDARFIHAHCPVAEFGLVGLTMHKADERVDIADITRLTAIYEAFLDTFFSRARPDAAR